MEKIGLLTSKRKPEKEKSMKDIKRLKKRNKNTCVVNSRGSEKGVHGFVRVSSVQGPTAPHCQTSETK